VANVIANLKFPTVLDAIPVIGLAVWIVILATAPLRQPDWAIMPKTFKGTVFLLALSPMRLLCRLNELPVASWQTVLGLGFLSSVFDNIPLTALNASRTAWFAIGSPKTANGLTAISTAERSVALTSLVVRAGTRLRFAGFIDSSLDQRVDTAH
jgi:hypothetical protein